MGCVWYMGLLYAGEPLRTAPFCIRCCCNCGFCIWLKSNVEVVGVCMKAMDGSPLGLKDPLSWFGKGWASFSQFCMLISMCVRGNPSVHSRQRQHTVQPRWHPSIRVKLSAIGTLQGRLGVVPIGRDEIWGCPMTESCAHWRR